MRNKVLFSVLVAAAALASAQLTRGGSIESRRAVSAEGFDKSAPAIPVKVAGAAQQNLRCEARVRYSVPGSFGRCHFNRVVTEVRTVNGQIEVSCGELEVACR